MSSIGGNERMQRGTSKDAPRVVACTWVVCLTFRTRIQSTRRCTPCSRIIKCKCAQIFLRGQTSYTFSSASIFGLYLINSSSEAVSKLITPHPSTAEKPGSHYYLFVDFSSAETAAAAAQALDGSPTQWGGTLRVNIARNNTNRNIDTK